MGSPKVSKAPVVRRKRTEPVTASGKPVKAKNGDIAIDILPTGQPVWGRNAAGIAVCYSPRNGTDAPEGSRCMRTDQLSPVNGRCPLHGGLVPGGTDSPHFRTGKWSKYAGAFNREDWAVFQELLADRTLTSLRDDIAAVDLEIANLYKRYGGIPQYTLGELQGLTHTLYEELKTYEEESVATLLRIVLELNTLMANAVSARQLEEELERKREHRRKLVDTENKEAIARIKSIPMDRFLALMADFRRDIRECVSSPEDRKALSRRLLSRVGINVPEELPASAGAGITIVDGEPKG